MDLTTENASDAKLSVIESTAGWAMGAYGNCFIVIWRSQPTPDAFRMRNAALQLHAAKYRGHSAYIDVIEPNSTPPQDDARRVAMSVYKELGDQLSAIAICVEGTYVRSTLVRAILTTMMFFVKQMQPTKVFKTLGDAVDWVKPTLHAPPGFDQQLLQAVADLRTQIKPR